MKRSHTASDYDEESFSCLDRAIFRPKIKQQRGGTGYFENFDLATAVSYHDVSSSELCSCPGQLVIRGGGVTERPA